jgi:hypothetical protein
MTATLSSLNNVRQECEAMLTQLVADNPGVDGMTLVDLLDPDQRHLMSMAGFTSPAQVGMEVGRVHTVASLKAQAGSSKQRKAAEKRVKDAAAALATESVALKSAIEEAQAKLAKLDRESRDAVGALDRMNAAVEHLKADPFLPSHVVEQAAYARRRAKASGDAEQLRALEARISELTAAISVDTDGGEVSRLDYAKHHVTDAAVKTVDKDNRISYSLDVAAWSQHIDACRVELAKIEPQAMKLRAKVTEELHRCEGCRCFYLEQLG